MKILHLIDSGGLYGAEKMLLSLVQEQLKQGLEPMILSAGELDIEAKPIEVEATRKGLPVTAWRMAPGLNLKESNRILKWAQRVGYDLLHSHGFKFNVLFGIYPLWVRRIPMVSTLHGYVQAPRFSKLWIYEYIDRLVIRNMQGIVLVSESMKTGLPKHLLARSTEVIPNGLNIDELERSAETKLSEPLASFVHSHKPVIIGVGRLSPEKGFDSLISAFFDLKQKHPNAGLIIVGDGGLRAQLESMIRRFDFGGSVLMPGYCDEVPALLSSATVLVMPSLTEGLPIALLEAMSLNTSIVASAVGEIPEVLGDGCGGTLLNDTKPETIVKAIECCITETGKSSNKAQWAYDVVKCRYSSEVMSARYRIFYSRLVGIS
ncbi:MAG: glycosyl transferase [Marinobacter sp.]|mgnify:CR=1 FL=1|nr:glycosyl transferase [Marinobacter sp.]